MATQSTNIDQFIKDANKQINDFAKRIPDVLAVVTLDAIALIKNRVIQAGNMVGPNEEEVSFPAYSEAYAKKREKRGLSPKANRLVFEGNMLRSIKIIGSGIQDNKYVVIAGSTGEEQQKVNYNSNHYGDIFKLSKKEQKQLGKTFSDEMTKILK